MTDKSDKQQPQELGKYELGWVGTQPFASIMGSWFYEEVGQWRRASLSTSSNS